MAAADTLGAATPLTIPQRVALAFLRAYQLLFSQMFAGSCRFVPSCSAYAVEAVARFGVLRGSWLALRRLSRCRPMAAHGFDPVPDPGSPHHRPAATRRPQPHAAPCD